MPEPLSIALAALAAVVVAALASARFARSSRLLDHPNARSLHRAPVPRTGGIAVLAGLLAGGAVLAAGGLLVLSPAWAAIAIATGLIAAVSYLDDHGGASPLLRLAVHFLAGGVLVLGGVSWGALALPGVLWPLPAALDWALTLLFVVWMVNLYNFMDGMDGFAGGMAAFGFGTLTVLGALAGDLGFAGVCLITAAAPAGFLTQNFPPARIFLGDIGSTVLGLLAAALSLLGAGSGLFPLWAAVLAFSPFIVDASFTLLRRAARGERLWQAHRSHHYQRLVLAGWSHRRTVLRAYALMAACGATAVATVDDAVQDQWVVIGVWVAVYALIGYQVALVERMAGNAGGPG